MTATHTETLWRLLSRNADRSDTFFDTLSSDEIEAIASAMNALEYVRRLLRAVTPSAAQARAATSPPAPAPIIPSASAVERIATAGAPYSPAAQCVPAAQSAINGVCAPREIGI